MVKSKKDNIKQKQSQVQKVVVNVVQPKRRTNKRRATQKVTARQPTQQAQISQSIPYLGLQSANNAQLLNSLQATLSTLYTAHTNKNKLLSAPETSATQHFGTTVMPTLTPPAPPAPPMLVPPTPAPPNQPPQQLMPPPPPSPEQRRKKKKTKLVIDDASTDELVEPPQATRVTTPPPPAKLDIASLGVRFNQDGTVRKRGAEWASLSPEQKEAIRTQEQLTRPVRAKKYTEPEPTDDEDMSRAVNLTASRKPFNSTVIPVQAENKKPKVSILDMLKPGYAKIAPFEGVEELRPETRQKPDATKQDMSLLKRTKPEPIAVMGDTDTEYGKLEDVGYI